MPDKFRQYHYSPDTYIQWAIIRILFKMPIPTAAEFDNFIAAAKAAVDNLQARNTPISTMSGRPRYCKSATFIESTGSKICWATLWRSGPTSEEIICDDALVEELKKLAALGPTGGVKEINGVKWMFEKMEHLPSFVKKKPFPRQESNT